MLKKIFGRHKQDKKSSGRLEDSGTTTPMKELPAVKKEYATFSAQFPPTDFNWYKQQVQALLQEQYQSGALCPKHQADQLQVFIQQQMPVEDSRHGQSPMHLHREWVPDHTTSADRPMYLLLSPESQLSPRPHSCSSHSHDSWSSGHELSPSHPTRCPSHHKARDRPRSQTTSPSKSRKRASHKLQSPQDYDLSRQESNFYYEPESVDSYVLNQPPPRLPQRRNEPDPEYVNLMDFSKTSTAPQLACPGLCGSDISVRYLGQMPKKNVSYSMSRDSGVNCIGLAENGLSKKSQPGQMPKSKMRERMEQSLLQDSGFGSPHADAEYGVGREDLYRSMLSITGSQFYPSYQPTNRFIDNQSKDLDLSGNHSLNADQHARVIEHSSPSRWQQAENKCRVKNRESLHVRSSKKENRDSMLVSGRHSNVLRQSLTHHGSDQSQSRSDFLKDCKVVGVL